jgi:hypothetical protein
MAEISKVKIMDLDTSKFRFKPSKPRSRFRELYVDLCPLVVKFPKLRIPFDSKINKFGQSEISMSLGGIAKSEQLIKKIESIDTFIQEYAEKEGFLEGFPETIRYNPILKVPNNSSFAPTIKSKISKYNGDIESVFFDKDMKEINFKTEEEIVENLKRNYWLLTSINFAGLYFNDNTWGLTTKFHHTKIIEPVVVKEPEDIIKQISFLDSSDDESDEGVLDEN